MDAETPIGGRDRTEGFALEKRRTFHRGTLAEPYLGGLCPLHWNVGLRRPRTSPRRLMMSSNFMDVLGRQSWQFGTCGRLERSKEG
jgi:hypothetical protein